MKTHLNAYPERYDRLRRASKRADEDYNSVLRMKDQASRDRRAKAIGYDSFSDLARRHAYLTAGMKQAREIERKFYSAKTDAEKYKLRDRIQEIAGKTLRQAGAPIERRKHREKIAQPKQKDYIDVS